MDPNLFKKESELIAEARAEGRKNKSNNKRDGRYIFTTFLIQKKKK